MDAPVNENVNDDGVIGAFQLEWQDSASIRWAIIGPRHKTRPRRVPSMTSQPLMLNSI